MFDLDRPEALRRLDLTGYILQFVAVVIAAVGFLGGANEAEKATGVMLMVGSVSLAIVVAAVGYAVRLIARYLHLALESEAESGLRHRGPVSSS